MKLADFFLMLLILSPLMAGGFIVLAKSAAGVTLTNRAIVSISRTHAQLADRRSFWSKYVVRTILWPFQKLGEWTERMHDQFWKAAVRVVTGGYVGLTLTFIALVIVYTAVVVAVTIAVIAFVLFILSQMGSDTSSSSGSRPSRSYGGEGESREREGFFGDKYTEHKDADGNVVAESREREGFFGDKYAERKDAAGNAVGESREREGIFGDKYTQHKDADGNVVSESREREGIFGDKYTEHKDADGNVVGESREREGLFGDKYTENKDRKP